MKKVVVLLFSVLAVSCMDPDVRSAKELCGRIVGEKSSGFVFEKIASDKDAYEIESVGDKIVVRGNNANSMAVGLNRYLTEFCGTTVSWWDYVPTVMPETLPVIPSKVMAEALVPQRFFLNYCTFGYTMPWWGWKEWERFIDWMALNGINMPLAITGQEAVWQKVWRKWGLSDDEIRSFFVGPSHLPWQRMCNVDRWEGPLPQEWIDSQAALGKKILRRERELGMHPVLPGFAGHVPAELADHNPGLDTTRVSYWGGFADKYRTTFLAPMDPSFAAIQKDFLTEQAKLYGTDHIYGVDPFNEIDAPYWDPETLAKMADGIYRSMAEVDPDAVWLQMGWLFYADQEHWTPENIEAYLTAVPEGRLIILDYYLENIAIWKRTNRFYGVPYIACYLGNFGGNTVIEGNMRDISAWTREAYEDGGENLVGIGSTLEGFGVNEPVYQFLMDKAWDTGISDSRRVDMIADSRFGRESDSFREAWHLLDEDIYTSVSRTGHATLNMAHPCFTGWWHWTTNPMITYDNPTLGEVWKLMLEDTSDKDEYLFDVANVGRQWMGNHFRELRDLYTEAYNRRDIEALEALSGEMLGIFDDTEALLSSREEFSLRRWIEDARRAGSLSDYYEQNARTLVSVWGDSYHLCDYASRAWTGLLGTYYKPRWKMFFDRTSATQEFDQAAFDEDIWAFENDWRMVSTPVTYPAPENPVDVSRRLIEKYNI